MPEILGVSSYNLLIVTYVAIGTISSAYGLAVIGTTVGQPDFYTYFGLAPQDTPGYDHTTNIIGALNGVNSAGAIIGCIFQAWAGDYMGRKWTMQAGLVVLIIGGALCAGTVDIAMFIVARLVAGIGSGALACIVPTYQAEISTAETRGKMVAITGIMYAVGYSLAAWLGFACYHIQAGDSAVSFSWRFPLAVQALFPLVVLAGSHFVPESPRWLLQQGHREQALSTVMGLHRDVVKARQEFYIIEKQFELDSSIPTRTFEILRTAPNRRRALVAFALMWGDQFLGIFVMTNYGVLIYSSLGFEGAIPLLLYACWASFTLVGNTWTAIYVDRYGRRRFLLIGSIGCVVSLIFLCALSAEYLGTDSIAGLRAAVFFAFFYIFWWCFFMDATQYIYVTEIFPNHLRTQGVALGISSFYLASEVILVGAPVALANIGWKFYLVLIVPSLFYIAVIYFLFPETKGRTLEEIGTLFGDEAHVALNWYNATDEERARMAEAAFQEMEVKKGEDQPSSEHLDVTA